MLKQEKLLLSRNCLYLPKSNSYLKQHAQQALNLSNIWQFYLCWIFIDEIVHFPHDKLTQNTQNTSIRFLHWMRFLYRHSQDWTWLQDWHQIFPWNGIRENGCHSGRFVLSFTHPKRSTYTFGVLYQMILKQLENLFVFDNNINYITLNSLKIVVRPLHLNI